MLDGWRATNGASTPVTAEPTDSALASIRPTSRRRGRRRTRNRVRLPSGWLAALAFGPLAFFGLSVPLFAIGAVTQTTLLAAVAACAAWALAANAVEAPRAEGRWHRAARVAVWLPSVGCGLALVPLPPTLLSRLSPVVAATWQASDVALRAPLGRHPLSLDPPATAFTLATAIACALAFEAATRTIAARSRLYLGGMVVALVVLFDVVALTQGMLGFEKVYGIYAPKTVSFDGLLRPVLLNVNHAAAISAVAPALAVGLALEDTKGGMRWLWLIAAGFTGLATLLFLSRSGIGVLALEVLAFVGYLAMRQRQTRARLTVVSIGALAAVTLGLVAVYVGRERFVREATDHDLSKLKIPFHALSLVRENWRFGVGPGAFASSFARWSGDLPQDTRFTHVESWPVQLLADFGVPFALVVIAVGAGVLLGTLRDALRRPSRLGAWIALVGLVVHDLVDFSLYFAGVGVVGATLLALVSTDQLAAEPNAARVRNGALLALLAALGLVGWHASAGHDVTAELADVRQLLVSDGAAAASSIELGMRRHPAEPGFPLLLSIARPSERARLLVHTQHLDPNSAAAHVELARHFVRIDRKPQAWAEYRAALRAYVQLAPAIVEEMVRAGAPLEELTATVDDGALSEVLVAALSRAHRDADARAADDEAIERFPPALAARARSVDRALAEHRPAEARRLALELQRTAPDAPEGYLALARAEDEPEAAERSLAEGARRLPREPSLLRMLMIARARRLGVAAVSDDAARLKALLRERAEDVAPVEDALGDVEQAQKHPAAALRHYLAAADEAVSPVPYVAKAASLAEGMSDPALAETLYERLVRIDPDNAAWSQARDRLRASSAPTRVIP
jgi:hypothetical protein